MKEIFEQVFECSPVAMLLVNSNGKISLVNQLAERLFQYERGELIGQNIEILVPENVRHHHPKLIQEYVRSPLPRQMGHGRNLFGVKKDTSLFPIEVGLNPIERNGELFILSSVIDISSQHKAEERFKAAVDAAPSGMLMIDSQRKILMINKKIEEIFGYSRSELLGQSIETLVPNDVSSHHPKFVESYLQKPEPRGMGIGRELFGKHKSGKLVPVEIGLQPVVTHGETFVISSVVDITYRKRAEAEIKRTTEELEEFAYRTSHDLKSPLKSISGIAECIVEYLDEHDYQTARDNVEKISNLSHKLLTLIEDILTLTRVSITQEVLKSFDFVEFSSLFQDKYRSMLKENDVNLEFQFLHERELVVQHARLTQVLDNLISNAIKYCNKDKSNRSVKVRTSNDSRKFFIHICDNGIGIPPDRTKDVFGMFKRFHNTTIPGSGLGLYLVKKQIEKMGAYITFESNSKGTTFYLEFD